MLSKAIIFVFATLGIFALLIVNMPTEFLSFTFNPKYMEVKVRETFAMSDVVCYNNTGYDNMTYPYSSYYDGPDPPDWEYGLPSGQYMEVWWSDGQIQLRRVRTEWFGIIGDPLDMYFENGTYCYNGWSKGGKGSGPMRSDMIGAWSLTRNASYFSAHGFGISTRILFKPSNISQTIGEAWDAGKITYYLSYKMDYEGTGISAFTLLGEILTFKSPSLGVPGVGGTILNAVIAIPIWSLIAYIVYKIVCGVIPFISGGSGD